MLIYVARKLKISKHFRAQLSTLTFSFKFSYIYELHIQFWIVNFHFVAFAEFSNNITEIRYSHVPQEAAEEELDAPQTQNERRASAAVQVLKTVKTLRNFTITRADSAKFRMLCLRV